MRLKIGHTRFNLCNYLLLIIIFGCILLIISCNKNSSKEDIIVELSPPIIDPDSLFSLPGDCIYYDFQANFEVVDNDGDSMTVETNIGNLEIIDFYIADDGVSHWLGSIELDMNDFCGDVFEGELEITATDERDFSSISSFGPLAIVGQIAVSLADTLYVWPGYEEWMPVYLDAPDCFCLRSFNFTFGYDSSVLEVTDVMLADILVASDCFDFSFEYLSPNIIKFIYVNDLPDCDPADDICGINPDEPIFSIKFMLNPDFQYPVGFSIPVNFYHDDFDYSFNVVTDKDDNYAWFADGCESNLENSFAGTMELSLVGGTIKVIYEGGLAIGDLNLNGIPWEIGDAVLAANAMISCSYRLTVRQRYAADIDQDDNPLTIIDMMYLMSIVMGFMEPDDQIPPYSFPNTPLSDTLIIESVAASPGDELHLPVTLITHDTLICLQIYVISDEQYLMLDSLILDDDLPLRQVTCHDYPFVLSLDLILDENPSLIIPGTYHIGDLIAHVNPDIISPVTTMIRFHNEPDSILYTGLANPTFFEPVKINSIVQILIGN